MTTGIEFNIGERCVYCDSGNYIEVEVLEASVRDGRIFHKLKDVHTQEVFDVSKLLNCGMADSLGWHLRPVIEVPQ